jgi:hypothetical protein
LRFTGKDLTAGTGFLGAGAGFFFTAGTGFFGAGLTTGFFTFLSSFLLNSPIMIFSF